jgi:hypothetical protein
MIQLKRHKPEKQPLTIKIWWYNKDSNKWEEVMDRWFILKDMTGKHRFIFELTTEATGKFYIATHDEDVRSLIARKKRPVIPAIRILKFFSSDRTDQDLIELLPKVAMAVDELGAKVIN